MQLANDPQFYKILHLEKQNNKLVPDFSEKDFFFTDLPIDIETEFNSTLQAFKNPNWRHPRLNLPAACVFPARKKRIEQLTGQPLPNFSCPDLDFWRSKLKSTHASLLFAGAYAQNPASVFGHSLIRLSDRSNPQRNSPLLSYVMGFLASTGDDGSLLRIRKGLLGEYPGYYMIDPFYIKLGIYNNAESRDIWESDLNFTQAEIDFLIDHLWEVSHFSKSYFFIGRNCSYQVLKLFEAIRPELNLIQRRIIETLPHDSIRWVEEAGLTSSKPRFYPSLRRKISERFVQLSASRQKSLLQATHEIKYLDLIEDPAELDLINDYWLLKNYQKKTQLSPQERQLMETSLSRRASFNIPSPSSQDLIHREQGPPPAYQGHKTRSFRAGINSQDYAEFTFFFGAHGFDQDEAGFDSFSSIQYLGIQTYQPHQKKTSETNFILARIRSFENSSKLDAKKSWMVNFEYNDTSSLLEERKSRLRFEGAWGFSTELEKLRPYFLFLATAETDLTGEHESVLRPGFLTGFKWTSHSYRFIIESSAIEFSNSWHTFQNFIFGYSLKSNHSIYIQNSNKNFLRQNRLSLNYEINF